jgi:predicted N-acetyltransferase YhbS
LISKRIDSTINAEVFNMDQIIIRQPNANDIEELAKIEATCFPEEEAASFETLKERFEAFPENFLVAEIDGRIIGLINGCATSSPVLYDDLYHGTSQHEPDGPNLTVFGINTHPDYQRRGIGAQMMRQYIKKAKEEGRKTVILTCKEYLIHYYATFGFASSGISGSTHGGAVWYDMTLVI